MQVHGSDTYAVYPRVCNQLGQPGDQVLSENCQLRRECMGAAELAEEADALFSAVHKEDLKELLADDEDAFNKLQFMVEAAKSPSPFSRAHVKLDESVGEAIAFIASHSSEEVRAFREEVTADIERRGDHYWQSGAVMLGWARRTALRGRSARM